jgi:general secretion pathway protein D
LDDAATRQNLLARQVATDLANEQARAEKLRQSDPKAALAILEEARKKVEATSIEPEMRAQLLRRVDRSLTEVQKYLDENRGRIEVEEKARATEAQIEREQNLKLEIDEKLALKVDEYNQLMDEHRFAEALVVAKQAKELAPDNPFTEQLVRNANLIWSFQNSATIAGNKEAALAGELLAIDETSADFSSDNPYQFPDAERWAALTDIRRRQQELGRHRSEKELEIQQKLKTPVMLQYEQQPLSVVLDQIQKLSQINMHLDPQGLSEEGVTTDTPVTIKLSQEISVQSALNLILEPLHLSFLIKNEVLNITSERLREGEVYPRTYNVADLIVPIPNFVPGPNMGLAGAYQNAMAAANPLGNGPFGGSTTPVTVVASRTGATGSGTINPAVLAQMAGSGPAAVPTTPTIPGPAALGGSSLADFDSLISLITSTVNPTSWDGVGGPGSIQPFETNLSLVISQTQQVHEEVADLLEQLRRLQDLQVTIEVRFITVNDNFFEQIGVDFDFDIDDDIDRPFQVFGRVEEEEDPDIAVEPVRDVRDTDYDENITVGLSGPGAFSADLDIPFTQNSFGFATPVFGGVDPAAGANIGFAILSDIEAFFFIRAAQGNRRTNVMQAPKVTLFNGQFATVSDVSQSPFVISVIPVVGDFAAAQQPVIVVLSEGTFMTVQAVVSDDRRFVRLTVVPFFSQIGDVNTFTFQGEETTTTDTSEEGNQDEPNDSTKKTEKITRSKVGTTVQLPTFSFFSVTTTVSVPDGGTVLLGGIKRLSEGRNEAGVPILSKLPYINRLFRNVGIGREAQSIMMMVTPRIIIQEEEEERLGITPPTP